MRDPKLARATGPWWWPQIAWFWLDLTAVYAGLTWLGRRFGPWVLTTLACAIVLTAASGVAYAFIRGMDDVPNHFPGRARLIGTTILLLLVTSGVGCLAGYLLA